MIADTNYLGSPDSACGATKLVSWSYLCYRSQGVSFHHAPCFDSGYEGHQGSSWLFSIVRTLCGSLLVQFVNFLITWDPNVSRAPLYD